MKRILLIAMLLGIALFSHSQEADSLIVPTEVYSMPAEFRELTQKMYGTSQSDSLLYLSVIEDGIKLAEKRNNDREKVAFLYQKMSYYKKRDDLKKSNQISKQITEIYNGNTSAFTDGEILGMLGQCYENLEQYDRAYQFYL
ncbi:MAG: hypothetical protein JXR56_09870, partial [Candidatus Cloacimonetes bacterium]|nr:hypothetical protein [Candidatus Cloacimonadota bacterium]